jgi:hypothetical protein
MIRLSVFQVSGWAYMKLAKGKVSFSIKPAVFLGRRLG